MNFSHTKKSRRLSHTALNLASMIDVTFLLLIYFIVTTVFTFPEDKLSPALKIEDGSHVVRGYTFKKLEKMLEKNNLFVVHKSYITGPFNDN